jgi:hypothetical protein
MQLFGMQLFGRTTTMHALQSVLGKRRKSSDNQKRRWIRKVDKEEATKYPLALPG